MFFFGEFSTSLPEVSGLDSAALHFGAISDSGSGYSECPVALSLDRVCPSNETGNWRKAPPDSALTEVDSKESDVDAASKTKSHDSYPIIEFGS